MISTTLSSVAFTMAATTALPFTFRVFETSHLVVTWTDSLGVDTIMTENTHYEVELEADGTGGTCTLKLIEAEQWWIDGDTITLKRVTPNLQPTSFRQAGRFLAETHEDAFDRATMIAQEHLRDSQTQGIEDITGLQDELDTKLDASAVSAFGLTLVDDTTASAALTTLGVSTYAKTILDDASADAALTTLGVSTFAKTILDDANASAARTTLELGTAATTAATAYAPVSHNQASNTVTFDNQTYDWFSGDQDSNYVEGALALLGNAKADKSEIYIAGTNNLLVFFTPLGGVAIKVVAGEDLVAGEMAYIKITSGADGKVWKNPVDGDMPIGAVYANAAVNDPVYVVVSGIANVLPEAGVTAARGNVIYSSASEAGRVAQATSVPAAATHFRECGHWLDTGSGNGAATRAVLHFN